LVDILDHCAVELADVLVLRLHGLAADLGVAVGPGLLGQSGGVLLVRQLPRVDAVAEQHLEFGPHHQHRQQCDLHHGHHT